MTEKRVYLTIKEPIFKRDKVSARAKAIATSDDHEKDGSLLWEDLSLKNEDEKDYEIDEANNTLNVWGDFSNDMGFMSITIPLDIDLVTEIIQLYVKKMNKIKAMLEATK